MANLAFNILLQSEIYNFFRFKIRRFIFCKIALFNHLKKRKYNMMNYD